MLKRFFGRFLCLFFGHKPSPVTFTFPDRGPEFGDLHVITIGTGPQTMAVCFNACLRCDELARHTAREGLMTEKIRGLIAGEAKGKADAEAAAQAKEASKRLPGESIKAWERRTKVKPKLAVVPEPQPRPLPTGVPPGPGGQP